MQKLIVLVLLFLLVLSLGATSTGTTTGSMSGSSSGTNISIDSNVISSSGSATGSSTGTIVPKTDSNKITTSSDANSNLIGTDSSIKNPTPISGTYPIPTPTTDLNKDPLQNTDLNSVNDPTSSGSVPYTDPKIIANPTPSPSSDSNNTSNNPAYTDSSSGEVIIQKQVDSNSITASSAPTSSGTIIAPITTDNTSSAIQPIKSIFNPVPVSDSNSIEEVASSRDELKQALVTAADSARNSSTVQVISSSIATIISSQEVRQEVEAQIMAAVSSSTTIADNDSKAGATLPTLPTTSNNSLVLSQQITVEKKIISEVVRDNDSNIVKPVQRFVLEASNPTDQNMYDVSFVEYIPKELASSAILISSPYPFRVIQDDPIVEFVVPVLYPGEKFNLDYSIDGNADANVLNKTGLPVIFFADTSKVSKPSKVGIVTTAIKGDLEESQVPLSFLVGGAFLVILIVIVVLIVTKKKNPPTIPTPTQAPTDPLTQIKSQVTSPASEQSPLPVQDNVPKQ
jgi:hypothetical protein